MRFPSKEIVERVRREYSAGTRVELIKMDDAQAPPAGTKGTVMGVDDTGSLLMRWDNGSGLNVVYGEDIAKKLDTVTTICCREKKVWDSRKEAADFFLEAIAGSEGAECERYTTPPATSKRTRRNPQRKSTARLPRLWDWTVPFAAATIRAKAFTTPEGFWCFKKERDFYGNLQRLVPLKG